MLKLPLLRCLLVVAVDEASNIWLNTTQDLAEIIIIIIRMKLFLFFWEHHVYEMIICNVSLKYIQGHILVRPFYSKLI